MIKFKTEQLYDLHDRLKKIFLNKKNIPIEFQKIHFGITAELLKRSLQEENLSTTKKLI